MSFRFRSTACDDARALGIHARAEVHRARTRARPRGLSSQPTAPGHGAFRRARPARDAEGADEFEGRFGGDATGGSNTRANDPDRVDAPRAR